MDLLEQIEENYKQQFNKLYSFAKESNVDEILTRFAKQTYKALTAKPPLPHVETWLKEQATAMFEGARIQVESRTWDFFDAVIETTVRVAGALVK